MKDRHKTGVSEFLRWRGIPEWGEPCKKTNVITVNPLLMLQLPHPTPQQ